MATAFAGASLLPLTLGLGVAIFVNFEQLFNRGVGIAAGVSLAALALLLPYGLGFWLREKREQPMQDQPTGDSLKSKIDQMLTEARVIIPGAQALLGFQLIAVLTKPFSELPPFFTYLHCVGLSAVALSVILLMTPAALHRIGRRLRARRIECMCQIPREGHAFVLTATPARTEASRQPTLPFDRQR